MNFIWNQFQLSEEEQLQQQRLQEELKISPTLCRLLVRRGVTNMEEARKFFRPQLQDLHDPFLIKDMDKAVERLNIAIRNKEKILIYGDYDVDGTTAVALVYRFLSSIHFNLDYYIPDRYTEGYGISYKGIDFAKEHGFSLIIALDCGIKDVKEVNYAKELGIDFIICDHHTAGEELPNAVAVLDAKREDSTYPFKHLSGCGVGFKFMQAFSQKNDVDFSHLNSLLGLLTVSIASDIVPVTGENRTLAYYGLKRLNENPDPGLRELIVLCGLEGKELNMADLAYKIGPRLNASGRIQSGRGAVELLITSSLDVARQQSVCVNEFNNTRRELDKRITEKATELLSHEEDFDQQHAIVVYSPEWHKGVLGIVASRLVELYYKPSIVLTLFEGMACGSARSVQGFDIYKALESCSDLLENFGGHTYAAGLSLKEENIQEFERRFKEYANQHITPAQLQPVIEVDAEIGFKEINSQFYRILKQFGPFGEGNVNPIFITRGVCDQGSSRLVGKEHDHIKLELVDSKTGYPMNGIAFGMQKHFKYISSGNPFDICYRLEENVYNKNTILQLNAKDIKPSN